MSGLFGGGPKISQQPQKPQYKAAEVDMTAENAATYERMRRASAYGRDKTMLTGLDSYAVTSGQRKSLLGATQ
jgi:hypothetical protein